MARTNTNRKSQTSRPAPQPELTPSNAEAIVSIGGTVDKAGKPNLFDIRASARSALVAAKLELLSSAAQGLAQAAELMADVGADQKEARNIAERQAIRLYQGRILSEEEPGHISADEVTETLGNVFGRKPLTSGPKAGQPGRTPAGLGEEIRKRIVRATSAAEFVFHGDGGRYFEGMPEEPVAEIVQKLDNKARSMELRLQAERALASDDPAVQATAEGLTAQAMQLEASAVTLWTAYDDFQEAKKKAAESPVNMAFDPSKLAKLIEQLSADGAIATVKASEPLMDAYADLYRILVTIGEPEAETEAEGDGE